MVRLNLGKPKVISSPIVSCNNGNNTCDGNGYDGNGTIGAHSCNSGPYKCAQNGRRLNINFLVAQYSFLILKIGESHYRILL